MNFEVLSGNFCHVLNCKLIMEALWILSIGGAVFGISGTVRQVPKFSVIDLPSKRVGEVEALHSAEL